MFTETGPFPISSSQSRRSRYVGLQTLAPLKDGWWACTQGMLPTLAANGTIPDFTRPSTFPFPLQHGAGGAVMPSLVCGPFILQQPQLLATACLQGLRPSAVGEESIAANAFQFMVPWAFFLLHRGDTARDHLARFPGHCTPFTQGPLSRPGFVTENSA